jgi:hypothetical protein
MTTVATDRLQKYSIIVVDPETNQPDPNLTDYFSGLVRDLPKEADDRDYSKRRWFAQAHQLIGALGGT